MQRPEHLPLLSFPVEKCPAQSAYLSFSGLLCCLQVNHVSQAKCRIQSTAPLPPPVLLWQSFLAAPFPGKGPPPPGSGLTISLQEHHANNHAQRVDIKLQL